MHPDLLAAERQPETARKRDVWEQRYRDINEWEQYLAISPEYPPPDPAAAGLMAQARAELLAERPGTT